MSMHHRGLLPPLSSTVESTVDPVTDPRMRPMPPLRAPSEAAVRSFERLRQAVARDGEVHDAAGDSGNAGSDGNAGSNRSTDAHSNSGREAGGDGSREAGSGRGEDARSGQGRLGGSERRSGSGLSNGFGAAAGFADEARGSQSGNTDFSSSRSDGDGFSNGGWGGRDEGQRQRPGDNAHRGSDGAANERPANERSASGHQADMPSGPHALFATHHLVEAPARVFPDIAEHLSEIVCALRVHVEAGRSLEMDVDQLLLPGLTVRLEEDAGFLKVTFFSSSESVYARLAAEIERMTATLRLRLDRSVAVRVEHETADGCCFVESLAL